MRWLRRVTALLAVATLWSTPAHLTFASPRLAPPLTHPAIRRLEAVKFHYLPPGFTWHLTLAANAEESVVVHSPYSKIYWAAHVAPAPWPIVMVQVSSADGHGVPLRLVPGAHESTLGGRRVVVASTAEFTLLGWIEDSFLIGLSIRDVAPSDIARIVTGVAVDAR